MLSFAKMENFYKLTTAIGKYENILSKTDDGLKATVFDGMPHVKGEQLHKMDDLLLKREKENTAPKHKYIDEVWTNMKP